MTLPIAIYNAFTQVPYSGSPAAVIMGAANVSQIARTIIAKELGHPATAFVDEVSGARVHVQFFSTVMELPMCGHGTMCLVTHLVESGHIAPASADWQSLELILPRGTALVEYRLCSEGRVEAMLDVGPAALETVEIDLNRLTRLLGIEQADLHPMHPVQVARADFIHLCLPLRGLEAMAKLAPDFPALANFCRDNELETVASFCSETLDSGCDLHVRDFCPAVGVAESAAAGTTNAALAIYAKHHGLSAERQPGQWFTQAEQGIEIGRPSRVCTLISQTVDHSLRVQVGGVASLVMQGNLRVP